jgi:hypothetical protein
LAIDQHLLTECSWSKRAGISLSAVAAAVQCGPGCSMDDLFERYRSSWCDMAKATPDVAFIVPLVTAGAQGAELPHRQKAQPSLLYSLANCSLLCALPGCCERSCVVSGKKLLLCAGCRWKRCVMAAGCIYSKSYAYAVDWRGTVALIISGCIGRCESAQSLL